MLKLTVLSFELQTDAGTTQASVSYDLGTDDVVITKGRNGDSLTIKSSQIPILQDLLMHLAEKIAEYNSSS